VASSSSRHRREDGDLIAIIHMSVEMDGLSVQPDVRDGHDLGERLSELLFCGGDDGRYASSWQRDIGRASGLPGRSE
jgi:hypothetical protein